MDNAITFSSLLGAMAIMVAFVGGITAIMTLYKYITNSHDKVKKWNEYDKEIKQIQSEQCMLTFCMMATLDGLQQLGCNGKVTEARERLDKHLNKQAHGIEQE